MDKNTGVYDEHYYEAYDEGGYERGGIWQKVFCQIADKIVSEINPKTVLDIGCAKGFLVEALRDRGVEAYGVDISKYAISNVREDIAPYCKVASATEELEMDYDLIVTIEVLEHLAIDDVKKTIANICRHSNQVLFSSTPNDFEDDTHICVQPVEFWAEQFSYHNYFHDVFYDASYISNQTMLFTKGEKTKVELIRQYEREYFRRFCENIALHNSLNLANERIRVLDENNIINGQKYDRLYSENLEKDKKIEELNEQMGGSLVEQLSEEKNARERSRIDMALARRNAKNNEEKFYAEKEMRTFLENELYEAKKYKQQKEEYESLANARLHDIQEILSSTSWKVSRPIRGVGRVVKKVKSLFKK